MKINSIKKENKILKRHEFLKIGREGKRVSNNYFTAVYIKDNRKKKARIGITVTKKIGKATIRNKIKRIVREFFRNNKEKYENFDINVIAKKSASTNNNKENFYGIKNIFEKLI